MKEHYYKIEITKNNISKSYIVSAIHELQARDRLLKELKLEYTDISKMSINIIG